MGLGSNQTVAGLKPCSKDITLVYVKKFKSDRCGIETCNISLCVGLQECSNQTVAGLKPFSGERGIECIDGSNQTVAGLKLYQHKTTIPELRGSNQTVAGLKQGLLHRRLVGERGWFKSDRCGIETL